MGEPLDLELLSEKTLPHTADLMRYCPSMDLVALASTDQQVLIYRLNGQRVYAATQRAGNLQVQGVQWKPNGQLLAIAWSDGSVRLIGTESSKVVHQFSTGDETSGVTCMAWASKFTSRKASTVKQDAISLGLRKAKGDSKDTPILDLPRDLSLIDIETSLPKLSLLAAGGSSEEVFSSRSSLDALFRTFDPRDTDAVDIMVVGTKGGNIHLSMYDSFVIGSFNCPVIVAEVPCQLTLHACCPQCSTHSLLMRRSDSEEGNLYFVPMDLRLLSASSDYLSLLASKSTTLQNLLRYINQVQLLMFGEWTAAKELPGKLIRSINETLQENDNKNIVEALYHSLATGHTFPTVREWLVDELTDRGHKRWDKAVTTGLENLRRLVHENMLPALERCSVILSRLSGIAKFQTSSDSAGFSAHQIELISDTVACLHLVSAKILIQVVDELELFAAFSAWLRYEIDRLASDASGASVEDTPDKEAIINYGKVMLYLETCMISSPMAVFFGDEDFGNWSPPKENIPLFKFLDGQLQRQESGLSYLVPLPKVHVLCKYLTRQANDVFKQIAEAEKRNVLFGKPIDLGVAQRKSPMDMIMQGLPEHSLDVASIAFIPERSTIEPRDEIQLTKVGLSVSNGVSSLYGVRAAVVRLLGGTIKDIKFAGEDIMLVLWDTAGSTHLLSIPYIIDDSVFSYTSLGPKESAMEPKIIEKETVISMFSKYHIPSKATFVPANIEINNDMKRILVLGEGRVQYKVFKFPERGFHGNAMVADDDNPMS